LDLRTVTATPKIFILPLLIKTVYPTVVIFRFITTGTLLYERRAYGRTIRKCYSPIRSSSNHPVSYHRGALYRQFHRTILLRKVSVKVK
jgi:hypothetical protein